jgi:hypothetical protein
MTRTYSGQGIDVEGTAEKCDEHGLQSFLVKLGIWSPGWCAAPPTWWSDPYWPMVPRFGGWGSYIVSRTELSKLHGSVCMAVRGAPKKTTTTAMEAILGPPPLHVIIETEAQVWIYRLTCDQKWSPKSTNFDQTNKFRIWSKNPPYRRRITGCFHKPFTVKFPDICEWQTALTQTTKGAWSGTQTVPRPIKTLVPGFIDEVQEGGTAAVLGSTTQYSRLKYLSLSLVYWRIQRMATQVQIFIFFLKVKQPWRQLTASR